MTDPDHSQRRTDWLTVWIATFGGVAAAMQVGKAGAALPAIRAEFGLSVSTLALYISLLSLIAATLGLGFGLMTRRVGMRRAASTGLAFLVAGSLLPVVISGGIALLISRGIDALGFALCTTSLPAMVRAAASPRRQSLAMGLWATWMPAGVSLALAAAALVLEPMGWRPLFVICALVPFLALVALRFADSGQSNGVPETAGYRVRDTLLRPSVARTAMIFLLFSGAYMVYLGFLPTILFDAHGMTVTAANRLAMISALCLIPFNLGTGWLLDKGVSASKLYFGAFVIMAISPMLILWGGAGISFVWIGALLFGAAAGVVPAIVWAQVPRLVRSADEAPLVSGSIYQGAGIGQILAPLIVGWTVQLGGNWWPSVIVIAVMCLAGAALAKGSHVGMQSDSA